MAFFAGLLLGVLLMIAGMIWFFRTQMIQTFPSPYGFEETIERLEEAIKRAGWGVPTQLDFNALMAKKGVTLDKRVHVTELCKPEYAKSVLEDRAFFAAMMPCRIGVYEQNGKVWLAKMNTGMMSKFLGGVVQRVMGKVGAEEHAILRDT